MTLQYVQSKADPCLHVTIKIKVRSYITIYIDDIVLVTKKKLKRLTWHYESTLQNSDKSRIILEYKLKGIMMEYFTFIKKNISRRFSKPTT